MCEPLIHIHQDPKLTRLIIVCKRSLNRLRSTTNENVIMLLYKYICVYKYIYIYTLCSKLLCKSHFFNFQKYFSKTNKTFTAMGRSRKDPHTLPMEEICDVRRGGSKIYFRCPKRGRGNEDIACRKG